MGRLRAGTAVQDGGDHVGHLAGVAVEGDVVVEFPVQVAIVSEQDGAELGAARAGDFDFGGGLERFPVLTHLQGHRQALVLQVPPDLAFERECLVGVYTGSPIGHMRCAEDAGDDGGGRRDSWPGRWMARNASKRAQ